MALTRDVYNTGRTAAGTGGTKTTTTIAPKPTTLTPLTKPTVAPVQTANDKAYLNTLATTGTAGQKAWALANGGVASAQAPTMPQLPAEIPTEIPAEVPQAPQVGTPRMDTSIIDSMGALKQAQLSNTIAGLDRAKTNALGSLDERKATIEPYYYNAKNTAAANSDVGAMNFAQFMASRGVKGNAGAMPEIYRNNALQGQIGALDSAQTSDLSNIERDKYNLESNYQSDVAGANAGVEAQYLENYISQMNADRSFGVQEAGLTGNYNGSQTMAGRQEEFQNQMSALEIAAKEIELSYLPDTYKQEAALLKQKVAAGVLDVSSALAKMSQIKSSNTTNNYTAPSTASKNYLALDAQLPNAGSKEYQISAIESALNTGVINTAEARALLSKYGLQ